ncbi:unnamed protein product [Prorocentrum cordatum]|uniref:Secreted protein n=2 Tax=Prorocentrum cordatum TaxID=2364126 RepID=A0ABN9W6Z3_9DINO|nr:unnamed protein product [Polarella glacialis]
MQRALGKVELQLAHVYLVGLRHSSRPPLRHSDAVRTSQRNEEARGEKTRSTTKKLLLLWTPFCMPPTSCAAPCSAVRMTR